MKVRITILAIIGWYLLLIVVHYFNQRPLWNDEQCILFNIQYKKPWELFCTPLLAVQEFPRIYLYTIQQFSHHFNFHLWALRFFPFLCMLMASLIWFHIAQAELREGILLLTFVACWAASAPLIYYAAELKQYSMDVLAGAIFVLFLRNQKKLEHWYWVLPLFGLFSYPAFLFMPLVWYNLFRKGGLSRTLIFYTLICLTVAGLVYFFDIRVSHIRLLQKEWCDHFISFDSWKAFFKTLGENFDNFMSRWFVEHPRWLRRVARFFIPIGLLQLWMGFGKAFRKDGFLFYSVNSIAFAVFCEHLILGIFHIYPFVVVRTSLFFAPMLLLLTAKGLGWIQEHHRPIYTGIQYSFFVYLGYISIGIARLIFAGDLGAEPFIWQ